MPKGSRRSQRAKAGHPELDVDRARIGGAHLESGPDGEWRVRSVRSPDKTYRCPGCAQEIVPGTIHVVAWSAEGIFGEQRALEERRHWHTACWRGRTTRR